MLHLNLPEIDKKREPPFADPASCGRWISQFQLTDIRIAHGALSEKLREMNRSPLSPLDRLKISEQLRDTVNIVQGGYAKKIVGKPLPFNEIESSVLNETLSLWAEMVVSYGHCMEAGVAGDAGVSRHLPLISQRCLRYTALQIIEYLFAQHQVRPSLWLQLHRLYFFSEGKGFSTLPVLESLKLLPKPASCAEHFIRAVLIAQADPYELSRMQFQVVNRWAEEWAPLVNISRDIPATAKDTPPLTIDLVNSECVSPNASGPAVRYLDTAELGKNLRIKIALLRQGQAPSGLGLGDDVSVEFCLPLMEKLHQYWCEGKKPRGFEKRTISHETELCFGLEALHEKLGGRGIIPEKGTLSARQHEEIRLFGHVVTKEEEVFLETEKWDIQDENAAGYTLIRLSRGQRVSPGHLVGIHSGKSFIPCVIRWVIGGLDGSVNMGLRLIEGRPEPVAVRPTGVNAPSAKYGGAILLHLKERSSIVMPKGWYARYRIVEILDKDKLTMQFRLEELVGKGADYERATFTEL